jgi:predicted dehydrogenase
MDTNSKSERSSTKPPVRVGIIGAGWPGQRHADGYAACPDADVLAVSDLNEERRQAFRKRYDVERTYEDYQDLLEDPDIEAVSIALPNFLHKPATLAALDAGKHVLCEKPPALTHTEAEAMEAAAEDGHVLAYALQRRFLPATEELHQRVQQGALGTIYHARAVWTRTWGVPKGEGGWFTDPERAGGGVLIDIGIHALDLAWYMMGCPTPRTVSGQVYNQYPDQTATEDSAFALIRFAGGQTIQLEASWILAQERDEQSVHFYGTDGGARLRERELDLYRVNAEGRTTERPPVPSGWPDAHVAPFAAQAADFIRAIQEKQAPRTPAAHGSQLMALIDAIYASSEAEREVRVDAVTDAA